ncbi:rRNA methyltransferase 1, mitochondrial isoform X1 [Podarcis raffonei]|uniref:rRNA methyltransferase 1, mitochondrial isoform X1 n=1 Tax=Podarcis raffonei TaxID=65483 RepID=UPI002329848F|nr:rRNA methyltransferase 1, mitochondrial isoform X1 [Podarcis raffonei]XP_053223052.1 rRNA methyltransferase 1, mitochondrial isoform X1 [Podarcis raffonei]
MALLLSFKSGLWDAARLPCAVGTIRHLSTRRKPQAGERELPGGLSSQVTPDHGLETAKDQSEAQPRKPWKGRALRKEFWRQFRAQTMPSDREELKNLRNDDFPERKRSPPQKPLPVERTKGSEILFGVAPCSLALARSKRNFFQLFLKAGKGTPSPMLEEFSQRAKDRGIPVKVVQRKVLDGLCKGAVHQGVCLEATPLRPIGWQEAPPPEAEGGGSQLLWLALEGIQDPMNLGAILRSAHFLGVDRIVMSQRNSCPLTPVVSKASSGAMEVLDVYNTDDLQSLLKAKSEQGWEVLGTAAHTKDLDSVPTVSCLDFRWKGPTILLLGSSLTETLIEAGELTGRCGVAPGARIPFRLQGGKRYWQVGGRNDELRGNPSPQRAAGQRVGDCSDSRGLLL